MDSRQLEKLIVKACLLDKSFLVTIATVFHRQYFDNPVIAEVFTFMKDHVEKYGNIAPREAIISSLDKKYEEDVKELFLEIDSIDFDVPKNYDYLFDQTNEYLKEKAIKSAILESVDVINRKDEERTKIRSIIEAALCKDLRIDIGLDYFEMLGERLKRILHTSVVRVPTYFPQFDEYLNGGFPPFTFSVIVSRVHGFKCVGGNTVISVKDDKNNIFCIEIQDFYKYIETVNKYKSGEVCEMPSIESFIRKYGEEGKEKYLSWKENVGKASKNRNTIDFFISKYGEDVGRERYNLYIERQRISHSEQVRGKEKHKEISSRSGNNRLSYIKKYGEEDGIKRWEERQKKWLLKMQSKTDEEKKIINEKKKTTLNNFIARYGETEGKHRYRKMLERRMDTFNSMYPSMSCKGCLDEIERRLNIVIDRECFVDRFVVDGLYKNNVIEFYGDYFHCNPILYEENFYNPYIKKMATDKWKDDNERIDIIRKCGYNVYIIWESDWNSDKNRIIEELKNVIR